jgi:hypothetical protein
VFWQYYGSILLRQCMAKPIIHRCLHCDTGTAPAGSTKLQRQGRLAHTTRGTAGTGTALVDRPFLAVCDGEMATPRTPGGTAIQNKPIMIYLHPNTAVYDPSAGLGLLVNLVVLEGLQDVRCATVAFSGARCNCC